MNKLKDLINRLVRNKQAFQKMDNEAQDVNVPVVNAEIADGKRIAMDDIRTLNPDEIFVFGSNRQGMHGGGAAYYAYKHFGSEWGKGEGLYGQSYALPTMEGEESFRSAVERFLLFAAEHQEYTFLVTAVGCGIAGYTVEEVAPWFAPAIAMENVYLPRAFWNYLSAK